MVEYSHEVFAASRSGSILATLIKRIVGAACLFAFPALWFAIPGQVPEARLLGLAISIMLIGIAGLCLLGRR
jgi:hypothetical protein